MNSAGRKQFDLFTEKHGELRRPCIPKPRYLNRWLQFCSRGAAAAPCYIPRGRVTPGASHSATPHSLRSSCPAPSPRRPRLRAAPRSGQDRAIPAYAPASAAAAPSPPSPARPASPAAGAALPAWGPLAPNTARKPCGKEAPVPTRRQRRAPPTLLTPGEPQGVAEVGRCGVPQGCRLAPAGSSALLRSLLGFVVPRPQEGGSQHRPASAAGWLRRG